MLNEKPGSKWRELIYGITEFLTKFQITTLDCSKNTAWCINIPRSPQEYKVVLSLLSGEDFL